jgi:diguanylate cyclase
LKEFLERAAREGKLSYRDLHIVLDAVPTPISWASLLDGRILFTNRAFKRAYGYDETDFQTVEEWAQRAYARPKDRRHVRARWNKILNANATGVSEFLPVEIQIRCADGTVRTAEHRGVALHDIGIGIGTFDDISDRKMAEAALHRIAFEDPLTGLPNRRALQDQWTESLVDVEPPPRLAALLLIDLDGFKGINDRLGHDAGDETLVIVAGRLRGSLRAGDFICRLGGDEFVVLLPEIDSTVVVEQVCWRLGAALAPTLELNGSVAHVSASVGASLYPQDGQDLRALLKHADEAMYRLKALNKGGWEWFKAPTAA